MNTIIIEYLLYTLNSSFFPLYIYVIEYDMVLFEKRIKLKGIIEIHENLLNKHLFCNFKVFIIFKEEMCFSSWTGHSYRLISFFRFKTLSFFHLYYLYIHKNLYYINKCKRSPGIFKICRILFFYYFINFLLLLLNLDKLY